MSGFAAKRAEALEACDKVINGIEDGTITVSSALLLCMKIARLVNDEDGIVWLGYEYGGYPTDENGHTLLEAWYVAAKHGRLCTNLNSHSPAIFTELCGELETAIDSSRKALSNYSTQGYSASGELAVLATDRMVHGIVEGTTKLLEIIRVRERYLSILKSKYYEYAVRWKIELQFGNAAKLAFEEYQERVDELYSQLPTSTLQKLNAIEDLLEDGNPERYAQVLTSCRRLWTETAKWLFNEVLPDYGDTHFTTVSGVSIDISGDHTNNQLSAVIETLQSKAAKNTLVGSETIYLVDWMSQINDLQNTGVHSDVTREQAMQCIIHTYIALGDIFALKAKVDRENTPAAKSEN